MDRSLNLLSADEVASLGKHIARTLWLSPADVAVDTVVSYEDLHSFITTQAAQRTFGEIEGALGTNGLLTNGIPAPLVDTLVRKRGNREQAVIGLSDSIRSWLTPPRIEIGSLARVTAARPSGAHLDVGDVVEVLANTEYGSYRVTDAKLDHHGPRWAVPGSALTPVLPDLKVDDQVIALEGPRYRGGRGVLPGQVLQVISGPDGDGDYYCQGVLREPSGDFHGYWPRETLAPRNAVDASVFLERHKAAVKGPNAPESIDMPVVADLTAQVVESMPEVADLTRRLEESEARNAELSTRLNTSRESGDRFRVAAHNDMALFSELLMSEADRRNWCSEYDEIVEKGNGIMSVLQANTRPQERDCDAEIECEVSVELNGFTLNGTVTVTVSYTGDPSLNPVDEDYIEDSTVEEHVASALGVSYRSVTVDSWSVESYDAS